MENLNGRRLVNFFLLFFTPHLRLGLLTSHSRRRNTAMYSSFQTRPRTEICSPLGITAASLLRCFLAGDPQVFADEGLAWNITKGARWSYAI
jgi:hypothetical protein